MMKDKARVFFGREGDDPGGIAWKRESRKRYYPEGIKPMFNFFATTSLGLESVLLGELESLGMKDLRQSTAGVRFGGTFEDCMRANLHLRTSTRIVMVLDEFTCESAADLYEGVRGTDWRPFFAGGETLAVSSSVRDSAVTHSVYAALTVKDAVCDSLRESTGSRPNVDRTSPDIRIVARLIGSRAVIGLDTSGESLHLRGYRKSSGEAPIRETLAAGLALIAGWCGESDFLDPMCGSGTIPIEAALIARRIPPNIDRPRFGFMKLPWYEGKVWETIREEARAGVRSAQCTIEGSDIDEGALEIARKNAATAGVDSLVRFVPRDIKALPRMQRNSTAVVNPPYGARLGEVKALRSLYRDMGEVFRKRLRGSTAWVLTGNTGLAKYIPLKPSEKHLVYNGAIRCRYLRFDIK
jgi:putative N6-adenine-specific DNA methylase